MVSTVSFLAVAYVSCGLLPLALVPYIRAADEKPGRTGLLVTLCGLSVWAISIGLLFVATGSATYLVLATGLGLGGQLASVGYLLMAAEYTGRIELTPRLLGGLAALVVLLQVLSLTDPLHHLVWDGTTSPPMTEVTIGPLAVATSGLSFVAGGAALLLLVVDTVTASGVRRRQSFALVAAGMPATVAVLLDVFVLADSQYVALPFAFVGSAFAYAWALFRMDFLDIVPIGRKRIVEEMSDAAVVLDADGRVVECNRAARRLVGVGPDYAGTPVEEFFETVPDAVERFRGEGGVDTEIAVAIDGERRHFHLKSSRLDDSRPSVPAGRLIVLRDITELKRRERVLERRESELEFLRQVLARVLRHNIRNDLTVVRGYAELIAEEADDRRADLAETIVETSDDLLETSRKARVIERVVDREPVVESIDLAALLEGLVADYRARYEAATVRFAAPDRCVVDTDPWLENALDILLENALEHNDGEPTVEVGIDRTDDHVRVTIADDGPGIPPDELAVLEQGEETPLEHTSGVGLWIVHWIAETTGVSISFETDETGTRVALRVPNGTRPPDYRDGAVTRADRPIASSDGRPGAPSADGGQRDPPSGGGPSDPLSDP